MAACADVSSRRAGWELPAGDLLERQTQESAPKLGPELLPDPRVAKISLPKPLYLLLEIVTVGRRTVELEPDAKSRVRPLDRVQKFPRALVLAPAAAEVEVGKRLSDRLEGRPVSGSAPLPAGAVGYGQAAPVDERAPREVSDVRVAPAIEMGEQTGEHPQHEVRRQLKGFLPVVAREPGQPLGRRAMRALTTLARFARRHLLHRAYHARFALEATEITELVARRAD